MYKQNDIELIKSNMLSIKDEAMRYKLDILEPKMSEFKEVYAIILEYIKKHKKVVYGGYAQNKLIEVKNKHDVFYKDIDLADIEFYSYEPLKDVIEISDILHSKGFKYIQGAGGAHEETYKIFVNFHNYCDLSYMPKNVYDNIPVIEIEGIRYAHPHFMLVDAFRVYADPLTSYFRLDKTFNRFTTLSQYYPINTDNYKAIPNYYHKLSQDDINDVKRFVRHHILHNSELIVIGHYAVNYLVKKADIGIDFEGFTYYQAISIKYDDEKIKIGNFLKKQFGSNLTIKEFYPYFQFYDKHMEYYYNGVCILKLYGHNNRCIVNQFSENKKVYFGTFQLIFLYLLADYQYAITRKDETEKNNYSILISRLLKAREYYLDKHSKNVLDQTPFQEFTLQCLGTTEDPLRMARIEERKKKESGKQIKFRYDPKGTPGKIPEYRFSNSSGNEIIKK